MPLVNAIGMLEKAQADGYAVGAFNILSEITARAVVKACEQLRAPVILQTSPATVNQIGVPDLIGFLRSIADNAAIPVAVHLDHCKDLDLCRACIDAGWSSVMIDASHHTLAENISKTKEIVQYAQGKGISIEGELGAIGGVEDDISVSDEDAHLASVSDSVTYTKETGISLFAPAIGTAHGLYKGEPKIDFLRFEEIKSAVAMPLVIHGGTGLAPDVFKKLIKLGASKINISTAVKIAYLDGTKEFMSKNPDNANPLKLDAHIESCVKTMVHEHLDIFCTQDKA